MREKKMLSFSPSLHCAYWVTAAKHSDLVLWGCSSLSLKWGEREAEKMRGKDRDSEE